MPLALLKTYCGKQVYFKSRLGTVLFRGIVIGYDKRAVTVMPTHEYDEHKGFMKYKTLFQYRRFETDLFETAEACKLASAPETFS